MAQFNIMAKWSLKKDRHYNILYGKLLSDQNICLKTKSFTQCSYNRIAFERYLQIYTRQFQEKGEQICMQIIDQNNDTLGGRRKCIDIYGLELKTFVYNVSSKLDSIVNRLDFDNL